MDNELISKLTRIAHECNDEDVRAWIGKHLAEHIRGSRGKRRRGVHVRLLNGSPAVINAEVLENAVELPP